MKKMHELVELARAGDSEAFGTLWQDHLRPVALRAAIDVGARGADIDLSLIHI